MNYWRTTHIDRPVAAVVDAIRERLAAGQVSLFAVYDHAENARGAGLTLPEETVLVFGSPAVGTSLMQDDPDSGYDLPLRILVRADGDGSAVGYRDPEWLIDQYGLSRSESTVRKMSEMLRHLVAQVAAQLDHPSGGVEEDAQ
ncbi:DUF302 domain-containing protein [Leifsonia sp. AG29]|uniref:DUF302 domain-containing protein n=1 Tax=Leifsonia sp. AG29 TaxID=2598860 RepID=UPI00131C2209|nr:DUF302 domain-containing protein [Leifsonia sp. AG29]